MSVFLKLCLFVCLCVCVCVFVFVCLCVCVFVCVFVCQCFLHFVCKLTADLNVEGKVIWRQKFFKNNSFDPKFKFFFQYKVEAALCDRFGIDRN